VIESAEEVKVSNNGQGSPKLEKPKAAQLESILDPYPFTSPSKKTEGVLVPDKEGYVELRFHPARNNLTLTEYDRVSIISEFTGWMLEGMTRELYNEEVVYTSKYTLKAGFKYKFRFVINGSPVDCKEYPEVKNILSQSYNYVLISSENKKTLLRHTSYKGIKVDPQVWQEAMQKYFRPIFKKVKKGEKVFPEDLKMHIGRVLYRYKRPEGFYKLLKWNKHAKEATLRRISDNNGIPLDVRKFTKQEYYFLNELNSQFFFVGSKEEETGALSMLNLNKLKINYKTPKGTNYYEIVSIQPDNVPLQEVNYKKQSSILLSMMNTQRR
jgi:hypothetical protein